ncbi:MAG: hypothetical protein GEV06_07765 [Luteitalea sp.]|nr:hypothetical protein [Luteitalea sp.]
MAYTYDELHEKTIAELREIAKDVDHEAVQGHTQMNKEHLLPALCEALGIEMHAHHVVVGVDKSSIKQAIRSLKKERDRALADHDHTQLKHVRRRIHRLKRRLHAATV